MSQSSQVSIELSEKAAKIAELEDLVMQQRKDLRQTQEQLQEVVRPSFHSITVLSLRENSLFLFCLAFPHM